MQMAFRTTPTYKQNVFRLSTFDFRLNHLQRRYSLRDLLDFVLASKNHLLVVLRVRGDSTLLRIALQTDIPVLVTFHTRVRPITHTAGVTDSRVIMTFQFLGHALRRDSRQFCQLRYPPESRSVCQIGVGHEDDRRHVLQSDLTCLVGKIKTIGRRRSGNHHRRALAVTAIKSLQQVRLFGLRRQSRTRSATLHIDDNKRQFCHHRQTDGFGFERETGTGSRSTSQIACKSSADSRTNTRYFVLRLYRHDVHVFACREFMQDIRCRRDGIRTQEEPLAGFLRRRNQSPRRRFVSGDGSEGRPLR